MRRDELIEDAIEGDGKQQWIRPSGKRSVEVSAHFFADLAHDLRSPLGLVDGAARELIGLPNGGRFESLLWRGVRRIGHFADRMSVLAELEEGSVGVRAIPVDVAALVHTAIASTAEIESRRDVTVAFEPTGPLTALVDPTRTSFAIVELLLQGVRNARRRIEIDARPIDDAFLSLSIRDDGDPPALTAHLFDRDADRFEVGRDPLVSSCARALLELQGGTLEWDADGWKIDLPREIPKTT